MRKELNGKINKTKKKIIMLVVILIFLLYFCLTLTLSERRYLYIEKIFKSISSSVNSFFINNAYSNSDFSSNIISSRINYLQKENNNLRKINELKQKNHDYVVAEIVNHTSKTWFNKVTINAGFDNYIKKDLPVINEEGLIGFVSKTGKKISEVKLLTSFNKDNMISVFVETEGGSIAGMLSDYDEKKNLFKVSDITNKNEIKVGTSVVLSGYDNEAYKGIYIGKVVKEEPSNYGLSRTIWVESSVNFDDLMFVLVPTLKEEK